MSDAEATDATDIKLSYGPDPQGTIDLDQAWITWLASADVPTGVTGVDPSHDDLGGSETSYA